MVDEDGIRVISNVNRVLRNNDTGVLGTFVDDVIVERRRGGIIGREEEMLDNGEEAGRRNLTCDRKYYHDYFCPIKINTITCT